MCVCVLSFVWLFVTPWTVAFQAPLSMGFSRQTYWSGFPFPSPVDHPVPGIEPTSLMSPALADELFTSIATRKAQNKKSGQRAIWLYLGLWGCWLQVKGRLNNRRSTLCPSSRGASRETEWHWGGELGPRGDRMGKRNESLQDVLFLRQLSSLPASLPGHSFLKWKEMQC